MIRVIQKLFRPQRKKRNVILRTQGEIYDLQAMYDTLNVEYFDSKLNLNITWFGKGMIPKTRILFGSYDHRFQLIKINRYLDREVVPQHFVRYIIYHEMLHGMVPGYVDERGFFRIHGPEFKRRERLFVDYDKA
ncbi:MAG: hypothetical protein K1000chlam2_01341, partial [Chlamydiae bacterium]|nr:hypothetical protein [Chlamydiota bacterium]